MVSDKYRNYNKSDKLNLLLDAFNKANVKVALLCNHQKTVSKGFNESIVKINDKIKQYKKTKQELELKSKHETDKSKIKKIKNKIKIVNDYIKTNKLKKEMKMELKNVSLGTSKINYIDPRITVTFLRKHDIPVDKIFTKTLQEKFFWAFEISNNFRF